MPYHHSPGHPVQRDNHPPPPGLRRPGPRFTLRRVRLHWRGWTALASVTALLSAAIVLAELAAHYQPLAYGSTGYTNEYFRGLPTGKGIHLVNTVGGIHEDIYIPPQRGVFSLFLDMGTTARGR